MDDTVKRSDVLSTISKLTVDMSTDYFSTNYGVPHDELVDAINELEPAEERTGRWILTGHLWECDKCGCRINRANPLEGNIWNYHYCPNCGAKMIKEDAK